MRVETLELQNHRDEGQPRFERPHGTLPVAGLLRRGEEPC